MGRKQKETGYSSLAGARRLVLMRHEFALMGEDGRMVKESSGEVTQAIDDALEAIFCGYLAFKEQQDGYPHPRSKWDRTKWEKKLVVGMNKEPYRSRYLENAGLQKGGIWDEPNFG